MMFTVNDVNEHKSVPFQWNLQIGITHGMNTYQLLRITTSHLVDERMNGIYSAPTAQAPGGATYKGVHVSVLAWIHWPICISTATSGSSQEQ
jgi:hypothetical protein